MTLCNFDSNAPKTCPELQEYLSLLIAVLTPVDQLKTGSGDHEPTWAELADLWEGCLVPKASMVFWHNTDTDIVSWWFNPTGDYYEEF